MTMERSRREGGRRGDGWRLLASGRKKRGKEGREEIQGESGCRAGGGCWRRSVRARGISKATGGGVVVVYRYMCGGVVVASGNDQESEEHE